MYKKGPWKVEPATNGFHIIATREPNLGPIASLTISDEIDKYTLEDTAQLISCAPELLQCLKDLATGYTLPLNELKALIEKAKLIIAKAEGN
jgi:hypothetical protein